MQKKIITHNKITQQKKKKKEKKGRGQYIKSSLAKA